MTNPNVSTTARPSGIQPIKLSGQLFSSARQKKSKERHTSSIMSTHHHHLTAGERCCGVSPISNSIANASDKMCPIQFPVTGLLFFTNFCHVLFSRLHPTLPPYCIVLINKVKSIVQANNDQDWCERDKYSANARCNSDDS